MTRQIIISAEAHAGLCRIAALMRQATGAAVSFAEVVDSLLEDAAHAA